MPAAGCRGLAAGKDQAAQHGAADRCPAGGAEPRSGHCTPAFSRCERHLGTRRPGAGRPGCCQSPKGPLQELRLTSRPGEMARADQAWGCCLLSVPEAERTQPISLCPHEGHR